MLFPKLNDVQYAEAREIAARLLSELEPMVIGKVAPAWSCGCGMCKSSASPVVRIDVPDRDQITASILWRCTLGNGNGCGVSDFVPDLNDRFEAAFGDWARRHFPAEYAQTQERARAGEIRAGATWI